MFAKTMNCSTAVQRLLGRALLALGGLGAVLAAQAAVPGITGNTVSPSTSTFNLTAQTASLTMPDGQYLYSWGYGCVAGSAVSYAPFAGSCNTMQVPGPTLIVTEGQTVTVSLTNNLPTPAGNTSILFPGFNVSTSCNAASPAGAQGLLTCEAANGQTVTYTFTAGSPGTRAYYSGTQSDLQVEMGMYGAIIVLPASVPAVCGSLGVSPSASTGLPVTNPGANAKARAAHGEVEFRLAAAAYNHPEACYDREYLFQLAELDPSIHTQALAQVNDPARTAACATSPGSPLCSLDVQTEPYHPSYFLLNGRSMPDNMDVFYGPQYPNQPYNSNPHIHPGELMLLRVIGQGRWQHPFHEHANHVRILAYDGNLVLSPGMVTVQGVSTPVPGLAGAPKYTTPTTPGVAFDGIFTFTGRGLNWDMFGHHPGAGTANGELPCIPDVNGFNTGGATTSGLTYPSGYDVTAAANYYEWCADHNKPVQSAPFGDVATGGPMSLPDPSSFKQGPWYSGTPYFGPDAMARAVGQTGTSLPNSIQANPPSEAGWAFMWHSHNERELTTNNIFPGGFLDMMLVDSREFVIDETQ